MAKLRPPNGTKMTRQHYEWLAWSIRQIESRRGYDIDADAFHMQRIAEMWVYELKGTNPAFKPDRFKAAVIYGEW